MEGGAVEGNGFIAASGEKQVGLQGGGHGGELGWFVGSVQQDDEWPMPFWTASSVFVKSPPLAMVDGRGVWVLIDFVTGVCPALLWRVPPTVILSEAKNL
jgi:hypothetical protein